MKKTRKSSLVGFYSLTSESIVVERQDRGKVGVKVTIEDQEQSRVERNGHQSNLILFYFSFSFLSYRIRGEPWYFLSNGSDYPVYYEGVKYPTAEHLFQCLKFLPHAPEVANKVRKATSSLDAVKIARSNAISVKKGWIKDGINVAEVSRMEESEV